MFCKEYEEILKLPEQIVEKYDMREIAYFDIETTGFDKEVDKVILISIGYYINDFTFKIKQFFGESLNDEGEVLSIFKTELEKFNKWCSYNGIAFDEPFIKRRMERNNICFEAPIEHLDLYRFIRPYYKQMGMGRCNLKTVEKFIGIEREDTIDGAISVELYYSFLETKGEKLKETIMLHNYEDVLNLPKIFELVYEVENNSKLVREDVITEKQLRFLKSLLKKNNIVLKVNVDKISKKAASKLIDTLIKGDFLAEDLNNIIISSY